MTAVRRLESSSLYVPITTAQYHCMLESGILDDGSPIELLDGLVVPKDRSAPGEDPMGHNPLHRAIVSLIQSLTARIDTESHFLQVQLPIDLSPDSEPEPDGAIIAGNRLDYLNRLPFASEVLCVIEAADSSLRRDSTQKKRIYADARIPQFILINLLSRTIEIYETPIAGDYSDHRSFRGSERFGLLGSHGARIEIAANELLP